MLAAWTDSACVTSTIAQQQDETSRRAFLDAVDRALNAREPQQVAELADVQRWRATGRGELPTASLWLPPGPLKRLRDLTANEVVYEDAHANTWRLRMRRSEGGPWLIVVVPQPCPPKSMPRGPVGRELPGPPQPSEAPTTATSAVWTPLECWPLPR